MRLKKHIWNEAIWNKKLTHSDPYALAAIHINKAIIPKTKAAFHVKPPDPFSIFIGEAHINGTSALYGTQMEPNWNQIKSVEGTSMAAQTVRAEGMVRGVDRKSVV